MTNNPIAKAALLSILILSSVLPARAQDDGQAIDDYNFAAWLYNTGKYGLAVESYEAFLENHPKHAKYVDARFGLAQSFFHLDRFKEAAGQYAEVEKSSGDFAQMPELLFQMAQCHAALNQYADAEKLFGKVPDKFPDHYLADWGAARRAACLIAMGKFADAEKVLDVFLAKYTAEGKAPEKVPAVQNMLKQLEKAGVKAHDAFLLLLERSVFYKALTEFEQGRFDLARQSFGTFLDQYPKTSLRDEARFRMAQALYRQDQFVEAAEAYRVVADSKGEFAAAAAFERSLALHKAGKLKDASAAFAEVTRRFPESAGADKAALYAGTCLFEAGDFRGAAEQLQPLVEGGGAHADEAAYWRGMSLLKSGRHAEAEQTLAAALEAHPKSTLAGDTQLGLADARLAQDKFETAAEAFQTYAHKYKNEPQAARAQYSACVALHRADKYKESDAACDDMLKAFPKHELAAQALFLSGENRFLQKNYKDAARRYGELLDRKDAPPGRVANAHYRLAWTHRYAKRFADALAELDRMDTSTASEAVASETQYLKGVCLFETAQHADAAACFRLYLKSRDPSRFGDDAQLKLAVAEVRQNNKQQAVEEFTRFLRAYPDGELAAQARYQLAECWHDLEDFAKAAEQYELVARRDPPDDLSPYAQFGIGSCAYEQGKWADAARAFGAVAVRFKDSELVPQALYRQGKGLMKTTAWADAEQAFQAMLAAAPKHELARASQVAIATCLQEQKQWAEAADAFALAIDDYAAGEDQPRLYYEMAWSLREAAKPDEARAAFQSLANKHPDDALAADAYFYLAEARYADRPQEVTGAPSAEEIKTLGEARALYEKALAVSSDQRLVDKARYRIGWCDWLTGKYGEAAIAFDKLVEECPRSELVPDALFQSAQSYARQEDSATAVERFESLIAHPAAAKFTYLPEAYLGLSENRMRLNQPEDALKSLATILGKYEKHASALQAYFLKGKAQYSLKEYDDALASFTEVTRRTKSDIGAQARFYIGQIHQAREEYKAAILDYLRLPALYPDSREWGAASLFERAKCHGALGQEDEARRAYEEIVEKYSNTKWARLAAERLK